MITIYYNERIAYDFFNILLLVDFGIPAFNIPPVPIDYSPLLNKRAHYTPDLIPDSSYNASKNYVSTLTTPSESPQYIILTPGAPNTHHNIMRDEYDCGKVKIGY